MRACAGLFFRPSAALQRLFSTDAPVVAAVRSLGLVGVNSLGAQHASCIRGTYWLSPTEPVHSLTDAPSDLPTATLFPYVVGPVRKAITMYAMGHTGGRSPFGGGGAEAKALEWLVAGRLQQGGGGATTVV